MPKLQHSTLLLVEQRAPIDVRRRCGDTRIKRTLLPHVRDVCCTDHDLRWHAADVDTGATCDPPFNHCYLRAAFSGFYSCGESSPTASYDGYSRLSGLARAAVVHVHY
jgi:hypothetical protein